MGGGSVEAFVALAIALSVVLGWMFQPRRPRVVAEPPSRWRERLTLLVPQSAFVAPAQRGSYEQHCEAFLREKQFVGCNGLEVTDDMRIAVAGLACLLLLRPYNRVFPAVHHVLLYPDRFFVHHELPDHDGLVHDEPLEHLGESWHGDRVILSWRDVEAALHGDETNVVVHEFAHQLDDETPEMEGVPALQDYAHWAEIMEREFKRLRRHRRPPVIDAYGAESPGEFFAVVTEAFFQRGAALRHHHVELYRLLRDYYGLDPAAVELWRHPLNGVHA